MTFPCSRCGLCCQHVNRSPETEWLNRGDGVCINFDSTNTGCKIYDNRPDICRIDESFPRFSQVMTLHEYYKANAQVCNELQTEHRTPTIYKIIIREN